MRVRPHLKTLLHAVALWGVALPAAGSPVVTLDLTHQLTGIWVPATAYGLALIAAVGKGQR